ncbi:glycosyltransferase family 4 protein [Aeromonas hydrophila]|uniref:glycosyltransferase family 4 protein n=1 Tax=Aeromonas hydrophila TaxID=644 RepID=UPI001F4BCF4A|nr:glycosyltransferase family 4 protein [Aeromonas hydrophila]UNB59914.1 glycosyltransferase family 4 protein [Aeromonas hydrophila]
MKKIVIIIGSMIQGGAHRIPCMQANELVKRGYNVTLLLVVDSPFRPFFIDDAVKIEHCMLYEQLENSSVLSKFRRRLLSVFHIRKALSKISPDIVISHVQGTNREAILACKSLGIKIIVSEHTSIHMPYGLMGKIAYFERRFIYKLADAVTVLTKYDYDVFYKKHHKHVTILPNPTSFPPNYEVPQVLRNKNIVAVGDLNRIYIKGWDLLIPIFANIAKNNPGWRLQLAGGGEEGKNELIQLAKQHDVHEQVDFLGSVKHVEELLQHSSIFILTSRNEGMPMALLEAMSQGCACIAFNCKTGPADLLIHSANGLLIEDGNCREMSRYLSILVNDIDMRLSLGMQAFESSKSYTIGNHVHRLMALISKLT